jgi:hypothetical protein
VIFWMASLPEPDHVDGHAHHQGVMGAAVILGLILLAVVGAFVRHLRGRH